MKYGCLRILVGAILAFSLIGNLCANDKHVTAALNIIYEATKVEIFRVSDREAEKPTGNEIGKYPITGRGKSQDKQFAKKAVALLWGGIPRGIKGCEFSPGVAFRFWKDQGYADILVCFGCAQFKVIYSGKSVFGLDFDFTKADLVKLVKPLFPDDKEIQALEEK